MNWLEKNIRGDVTSTQSGDTRLRTVHRLR